MHERAHQETVIESRGDILISRGMAVFSRSLGINGICDIVELHKDSNGVPLSGKEGTYKVVQATLLARFLRGDLDEYPPFMWK